MCQQPWLSEMNDVFATNTREQVTKILIVIGLFCSFSKVLFFSYAAISAAIFSFGSVNLLTV